MLHTVYYAKFNIKGKFKFTTTEMTILGIFMVYGCCILLLFGTKSRPLCRNYNFGLLMHKHDLGLDQSCPWPRKGQSSKSWSLALALAPDFFLALGLGLQHERCFLDSTSAIKYRYAKIYVIL